MRNYSQRRDVKLILATRNPKKIAEIREILAPDPKKYEIFIAQDYALLEPPENGKNFLENAKIKAHAAFSALNEKISGDFCALSEDSGLCVAALNGAPGLFSARNFQKFANFFKNPLDPKDFFELFCAKNLKRFKDPEEFFSTVQNLSPDAKNRAMLSYFLRSVGVRESSADFVCAAVVCGRKNGENFEISSQKNLPGTVFAHEFLARAEERTFGYDSQFFPEKSIFSLDFLKNTPQKYRFSHRAMAILEIFAQL